MTKTTRTAVITAHGQPSDPGPAEAALARLAAEVAAHLPDWDIRSATLATPGRLEHEMADDTVVYPFFMSHGWFTAKVLPDRLQGRSYCMAAPFGLDAALPALAAEAVRQAAERQGWPLAETHLLLAAHGSARGPKAAEAAECFAARLRPLLPGCAVSPGYVEQAPRVESAATALPAYSICLPFFAQAGDHVKQDIPQALEAAGFQGLLLPVTGALPGIPALIAAGIRAAALDQTAAR
ncbi:CbiX/SirB N-terminal domain-containing protein [Leisingera methylohalidivorans]|uniref:Cobalamin (Vitamin B12) biosynthesis CbiX protein n=1 Tax=Leisingera methylohalidivorans DSM 14336 TaxID=999552 RepID=V9VQM3_9RHOB|nr:CbiX/SirB N-terminal domain-containing protein [Leisingera methylohalidivorans]AHD00298.1 cobalamin (vitamin B12) biosynthesis CbiX protein [Leisingera methylohalidivorans DSM 14336]